MKKKKRKEKGTLLRPEVIQKILEDLAEEKARLRDSEKFLKDAQKIAHVGHWRLNAETLEVSYSPELLNIFGMKAKRLILKDFAAVVHPEDRKYDLYHIQRGIRKGIPWDIEHRLLFKDGSIKHVRAIGKAIKNKKGKIIAVMGTVQDITVSKIIAKQLEQSLEIESYLSEISSSFINVPLEKVDSRIDLTLKKIAKFAGAARASLFLVSDDLKILTNTNEWVKVSKDSQIKKLQKIPFKTFGYYRNQLIKGNTVVINKLSDYPKSAINELKWVKKYGFRSMVFVPLKFNSRFYGTIGFYGAVGEEIGWSDKAIKLLRFAGKIFLSVLGRMKAELALKESEENFKSLFENSADAIFIADPKTKKFLNCNNKAVQLTGFSKKELFGKRLQDIHPKVIKKEMSKKFPEHANGKGFLVETVVLTKKKKIIPVSISAAPIKVKNKLLMQGIFRDVSESKRAEIALKEAKTDLEKLASIVTHTNELVNLSDVNGKMIFLNAAGCKMLGINPHKLGNHKITGVIPKKFMGIVTKELLPALRSGKPWEGDLQYINLKTKKLTEVHATTFPILNKDTGKVKYFANVSSDITARKKAEEALMKSKEDVERQVEERTAELKESQEKLQESYEELKGLEVLKSRFLTITSHELKTPLTPAKIQTQMLLRGDFGVLNDGQNKSFNIILRNIERLNSLIGDILEISQLESEGFKLKKKKIKLGNLVKGVIKNLESVAKKEGTRLFFVDNKLPLIMADGKRITQVITNLVDNAIKFTKNGKIVISLKSQGDEVLIKVSDTGEGIPKSHFKGIFKPFFQIEPMFTRRFGGTGLGLSICKGIVSQHGGKIWFESKVNKGTTFFFTLPIKAS